MAMPADMTVAAEAAVVAHWSLVSTEQLEQLQQQLPCLLALSLC